MANEAEVRELTQKLTAHVQKRYGSTGLDAWRRGFNDTDSDGDGLIDAAELAELLERADVGNWLTRGMWVDGVMGELDKDHDHLLSFNELADVLMARTSPAPVGPSSPSSPTPPAPPSPSSPSSPAAQPGGTTVAERLNNAIHRMEFVIMGQNPKTFPMPISAEVFKLAMEWQTYWKSGERALLPQAVQADTLKGFLLQYARCWVLLPVELRRKVPDPRQLDFGLLDTVNDSMRSYVDALREEGAIVADVVQKAETKVVGIAVLVIVGLAVWGWSKRR